MLFYFIYLVFSYGLLYVINVINVCQCSNSSLQISAQYNGYKGVVIALSPEINVGNQRDFIDKTQALIQSTSSALFESTNGRIFFEEVTIIVPKDWSTIQNSPNITSQRYTDADFIITERDSDQSFSMQFAGCGQHALPIVMTKQLILGADNNMNASAKRLVHEWAHYRYGVFNEFGFPSDLLYPAYYSIAGNDLETVLINSCTDDHNMFNYEPINVDNGDKCDKLSTSNSSGQPIYDRCFPVPDVNNNSFESSLMYSHSVNNVKKFCGFNKGNEVHRHNVNSPNKQNILCDGKDVWSVISAHKDLKNGKTAQKRDTVFKIWRDSSESSPRTLFAIPNSEVFDYKTHARSIVINTVLSKFTQLDLPDSQISLFTYNNGTANKISDQNWIKASSLMISKIRYGGKADPIDFETILKEGLKLFTDSPDGKGGIFVIIIGGADIVQSNSEPKVKDISIELKKLNIKLKIIVYPAPNSLDSRKHYAQLFETAISITGGQVFHIREEIPPNNKEIVSMSVANQIMKAFGTVLTDHSGGSSPTYHLIKDQVFNNIETSQSILFEFTIDESLINRQLRVYFLQSRAMTGQIIDSISLIDPNDNIINNINLADPLGNLQGVQFKISGRAQFGKWRLSAKLTTEPGDSLVARAEFQTISFDEDVLTAKCWLNTNVEYKNMDKPIIAYVNINKRFDGLISSASVKLIKTLHPENSGRDPTNETLDMIDNGRGDPDITKSDGIYSQYIVNIRNRGYYSLSAIITDNIEGNVVLTKDFGSTSLLSNSQTKSCCGSEVVGKTEKLGGYITRSVECGSFFISNDINIEDYPPNAVRDLRIESVDYYNRTATLRWTSTGGDYTSSNVNRYEIKAFNGLENDPQLRQRIKTNFDSMASNIEVIYDNLLKQNYGGEERALVRIKSEEGGVYYLALRAVDHKEHKSVVSNIVMAFIKSNVKIQSTTALIDVSIHPVDPNRTGSHLAGLHWWEWLSIGIGCAVVLLIVIIIIICFIGKNRRKNDDTDRRTEQMPTRRAPDPPRVSPELEKSQTILLDNGSFTQSVEKIPNLSVNGLQLQQTNTAYDSGSQQNLRELSANTLSPIQSWDAKDLLSHWGRVQEAKSRHEAPPVLRIEDLESASSNRSQSYASSEDDNTAIYTNPNNWRYQDVTARPTFIPNTGYNEPIYRSSLDPLRSNTPSDNVPRYSTINRIPTQNVSQV